MINVAWWMMGYLMAGVFAWGGADQLALGGGAGWMAAAAAQFAVAAMVAVTTAKARRDLFALARAVGEGTWRLPGERLRLSVTVTGDGPLRRWVVTRMDED